MENINKTHTSIKHWQEDDRPREKMLRQGAAALSPSELLAILINNGTRSKSALDLGRELLRVSGDSITQLSKMSLKELQEIKGIGPAKAVIIKAALELSIKKEEEIFERMVLTNAKDVKVFLQKRLQDETREHFIVIYLNRRNRLINYETISSGGISGTVVDVKVVIKRALEEKATAIILSHNHPSGNCRPSPADRELTKKMKTAAQLFDIQVLDHIIVSDEGYFSFAEDGLL
jgi:DNA repair protein RadC